jgi:hypothetical protein
MLIEAAWSYRFPARISREQLLRQEDLAKPIRDVAWKAQEALFPEQFAHELRGCPRIATPLHQEIENLSLVIDGRQSQYRRPPIRTAISSRCHCDVGRWRLRRSSLANRGPNFSTHRLTVS